MPVHRDTEGTVFAGATRQLRDRIVGSNDEPIVQADVTSISYTIEQDHIDPTQREAVAGHEDVALTVADVIFNTLQTDDDWTADVDATGFNFAFTPDISSDAAFATPGLYYLVTVTFVMDEGQPLTSRFRLRAL